jgi:hypothetical protein
MNATLTLGVVQRPKIGNGVCGDAWRLWPGQGRTLVALADGLGSGPAAAEAAEAGLAAVAANAELPLAEILTACHEAIRHTRGAAMGLLAIHPEPRRVQFAGVGNIEARTRREWPFHPLSTAGIVGAGNYRPPRLCEAAYEPGEWLLLHSDGLRSRFDLEIELHRAVASGLAAGGPQALADDLAQRFGRDGDDLTLLVLQLP